MILDAVEKALWFSGPLADCALCGVMIVKKRWRTFPAFFALVLVDLLSTPILYVVDPQGASHSYTYWYAALELVSFALQLAVLVEIIRVILFQRTLQPKARSLSAFSVGAGAVLAFSASVMLQPSGVAGLALTQARGDMFSGLLTCEIVIAVMISAKEFGYGWKNHVIAIAQGLMVWALLAVAVTGIGLYSAPDSWPRVAAYYLRSILYLATIGYWSVSLWRAEPARKPISPALRKYIVALQDRVHYDLGKVGH